MRLIKMFLFLLPSVAIAQATEVAAPSLRVLVCYGRIEPRSISGYDYVILEMAHYSSDDVRKIRQQNTHVLAYVSLGEVNENAAHFNKLRNNVQGRNNIWKSHYLNLKQENTADLLIEMMNEGFDRGFDGYFLDNIDNFSKWGPQKDQAAELVALMGRIRNQWPEKQFVQNAGLDFLPQTSTLVDAVMVESVATDYNFREKEYRLRMPEAAFAQYADRIKSVKERFKLPVILIEYADSESLRKQVEERLNPYGFDYFIANINLQTLPVFKR